MTNRGPSTTTSNIVGFIDLKKVYEVKQTPSWNEIARKKLMAKKTRPLHGNGR